jgi:hypothetical protein
MTDNRSSDKAERVYRVDTFMGPIQVWEEFIGNVRSTHKLLRTLLPEDGGYPYEQHTRPCHL